MELFNFRKRRLVRDVRAGVQQILQLPVREAMTDYVVTIAPNKCMPDASAIMIGEDVSTLVVEEQEKPVGVLTERDFINGVPATSKALCTPIKAVMSKNIKSVTPESRIIDAVAKMKQFKIRKLIVTRENGEISGIVTQTDLSRILYSAVSSVAATRFPLFVKDIMTTKIVTVSKDASFPQTKNLMARNDVSCIPVMDGKTFMGMLTEYDIVSMYYDAGGSLPKRKAGEIMKSPIKVIPSSLNIFDANMIMLFEKIRRLLVVEDRRVVGLVTQTDIVRACFAYLENMQHYLEEHHAILKEEHIIMLKRRQNIISEYRSRYLRAYTVT